MQINYCLTTFLPANYIWKMLIQWATWWKTPSFQLSVQILCRFLCSVAWWMNACLQHICNDLVYSCTMNFLFVEFWGCVLSCFIQLFRWQSYYSFTLQWTPYQFNYINFRWNCIVGEVIHSINVLFRIVQWLICIICLNLN